MIGRVHPDLVENLFRGVKEKSSRLARLEEASRCVIKAYSPGCNVELLYNAIWALDGVLTEKEKPDEPVRGK